MNRTFFLQVLTIAFAFGMCILVLVYSIGHISGVLAR
jgi:glycerol uptake facilitator-like aquaporin